MNPFSEIAKGFIWIGKAIAKAVTWVPKILTIVEDVGDDAATLMPQATQVLQDVDELAIAAVQDGGAALTSAATLTAAIIAAVQADALNWQADAAVIAALQAFKTEITSKSTWSDVLAAQQKLVTDWDAFGAAAEAALQKLEADASDN